MRHKIILNLLILIIFYNSFSQNVEYSYTHYTVEMGLSQGSINCIYQDKKGFLWFGTQDGLNKYDGYSFTIYQHNPLDSTTISSNWVYDIDEDAFGNIWVATQNGLNKLNTKTNKFIRYNTKFDIPITEEIFSVLVGKDGYIWFKTINSLFRLDTLNNRLSRFEHRIDLFINNKSDKGFPILEDADGIWVGTANGLFQFNKKMEVFIPYYNIEKDNNSLSNNTVNALVLDNNNNLWVGTQNGLNRFDRKKKTFTRYYFKDILGYDLKQNFNVSALCFSKNGTLWIGTYGAGIINFDVINKASKYYMDNSYINVSYNYILSLYEDRSMNLWIGYDAVGLGKIDLKPQKFITYRSSKSNNGLKLSSNTIASIYLENDSILWIGTWENGINVINRYTNKLLYVYTVENTNGKLVGNNVHSIFNDSRGLLWIGTKSGISIYDKKKRAFFTFDEYFKLDLNAVVLKNIRIYNINEDYRGNIWISTRNGLIRFNYDLNNYSTFSATTDSIGLYDNTVLCTVSDKNGFIWIGTRTGLNRYDYTTNKCYKIAYKKQKKLLEGTQRTYNVPSNRYIYHLVDDLFDENILWVGTGSGLDKFNKKTNTFEYYTIEDGLLNGTIYEILQDKNGNLWMSTNRGLAMFDVNKKRFTTYDVNDNIQGMEFNNGASYQSPEGEMFFGGTNGVTSFNPLQMKNNTFIPNVIFTTFEKTNSKGKKYKFNIEDVSEIQLNYDDYSITLFFTALEFTNPQKNSFKYWIEGLMTDWVYLGNKNFIDIGVLSPGEYIIHLKGSNNDGVWNDKDTIIKLIVKPPIYKTIWAYIVYVLLVGFIIFLYVRSRTKKLQEANEALRQKQLISLEIARQKEELAVKNKNITDSINYAKRIQEALLPSEYLFRKLLPDSFILYKPRDIVSGDFYWITEKGSKIFVAAVDCTGHGVPGAFMSIIGVDLLRNITREQNIEEPSEILNLLNLRVMETFSKQSTDYEIKDGMDVALLVIDRVNRQLNFAGAFSPLYIIRDKKLIEIKGNRFSIGKIEGNEIKRFDLHTLDYENNDMVYIFSDGYADQIGGPFQKKFKFKRFQHLLLSIHSLPLHKQKAFLEETFESWKGQLEQVDDILIIGIRL